MPEICDCCGQTVINGVYENGIYCSEECFWSGVEINDYSFMEE